MDLPAPTGPLFTALPDQLEVGTDPGDGWTQIVYDQHQIAAHEPSYRMTNLWLHLLEESDGRLSTELTELVDGLQSLQEAGYQIVDRRPVPIGDGRTIRIITLEGLDLDDGAIEEGVNQAYQMSRKAIREREL